MKEVGRRDGMIMNRGRRKKNTKRKEWIDLKRKRGKSKTKRNGD